TGRFTEFNPSFQKMLGYTREEILNLTYHDITPEKWHEAEENIIKEQVMKRGYSDLYEKEYIRKDGTVFPVEIQSYLFRNDNQEPIGIWAFIRDITLRKEIDKARSKEENRLRAVVENMPVMMDAFDENGSILAWNQECERVTGYTSEEIINNPRAMEMLYPDRTYRESMIAEWQKKGNNYRDWEWDITCKDGSVKTISWSNLSEVIPILGWFSWGIGQDITEYKKTLKELKRLGRAVEQSFDGIAMIDLNGNIRFVNRTWATMHGYERDELVDKHMSMFHPNRHMENKVLPELLRDQKSDGWVGMVEHLRKDGTLFPAWMTISILKNDEGQPIGFVSTARDITESKKAEQALKASEEKYRLLAETASDMILTHNVIGKITYTNNALVEQTGYNELLLKSMKITSLMPTVNLDLTLPADYITESSNIRPQIYETELLTKNCQRIPVEVNSVPLFKENQLIGRLIIARDIRERQQAEQALKESEARYRRIIENTIDLIYSCSPEGKIIYISPQVSRYGYTPDEVLGRNIIEFAHPDDAELVTNDFRQTVEFGEKPPTEFRLIGKDKTEYYVEEIGKVAYDGKDIMLVTGVIRDITDRKLAEKALRKSEERFRTMADFTYDWESWIGPDGKYIYVSPSCERVTGYRAEEFLRDCELMQKITHADDRDKVVAHLNDHLAVSRPHTFEFRIITRDGSQVWIEHVCQPVYNSDGRYLGRRYSNRDITERKTMLEALVESEEKYSTLIEKANDGILVIQDETIKFANKAMKAISGYTIEELVGMNYLDLTAPESKELISQRYKLRLAGKKPPNFYEIKLQCKDENVKDIELSAGLIKYLGKTATVAILRDITERKKVEEHIRRNLAALDAATDGIAIIGNDYEYTYLNLAHARMYGYETPFELMHSPFKNLYDENEIRRLERAILPDLEKSGFWRGEITGRKKDGTLFPAELSLTVLEEGGMVSIARDITNIKNTEKHRRQLQEKLERAERMESLGILAGGVAHDLNNMLGPMVAYSDLILEEDDGNHRTRRMVEKIGKASRIAADIIQDLLTMARRGRYEMTSTNLNDVIETYLDSPSYVRLTKDRPDIELELKLDPSIGNLHGSPSHLSKIVMNLVINAFDAMPKGGKLTIETHQRHLDKLYGGFDKIVKDEFIIFKVRDTGMGIDSKDLPKIFEPYYSKKKLGASGSGLGLAVVYGIVKDHRGYYDIISEVNRGTEFIFYFPVSRVREETAPGDSPVRELTGNEAVLVVDDVEQQRDMAIDLLTSLGYRVTTVAGGREAVDYLRDHPVDLVVLDMIMEKDFDGLDTYREIIKIRPGQKTVITSGYSVTERVSEMQENGAGAFVKKPYTRESLGRAIREELDKPVKTELTAG
ncbi:MAG: PAS domain S-box protein, partial [candidate division Zixibacteria bacterium]|nr:PAS domain S-box protein [candidate division Zixibacteria bacterium]